MSTQTKTIAGERTLRACANVLAYIGTAILAVGIFWFFIICVFQAARLGG